jgi:hypothetical protein
MTEPDDLPPLPEPVAYQLSGNRHRFRLNPPDNSFYASEWGGIFTADQMRAYARAARAAAPERDDGMPASTDERYLRRLLAYRVNLPMAYYDDGEAHGAEHGIQIDFMREPVADIDAKLRALNVARAEVAAAPAQPADDRLIETLEKRYGLSFLGSEKSLAHFARDWVFLTTPEPAAPPQPALTDEQIDIEWRKLCDSDKYPRVRDLIRAFARAVLLGAGGAK